MSEQPVFWLGGKPGSTRQIDASRPAAANLEPAIGTACASLGLQVDTFVAALGGFGSWLVEVTRDGERHRVIWNGKDSRLSLDRALAHGGWEELRACAVASADAEGFIAGIRQLLSASNETAA
jgi:hypothetical protein